MHCLHVRWFTGVVLPFTAAVTPGTHVLHLAYAQHLACAPLSPFSLVPVFTMHLAYAQHLACAPLSFFSYACAPFSFSFGW